MPIPGEPPTLPPSTLHTPWLKGAYDVAPNLRPLGDAKAFEFDARWPQIRANKGLALPGRVLRADLDDAIAVAVVRELAARIAREWPAYFDLPDSFDAKALTCRLTGEKIPLAAEGLDAMAANLPCDLAIVRRAAAPDGTARDWNAYLHVCAPSHWRPEEKIGRPFVATHAPIPHFERVNAAAPKLIEAITTRGPWVRFVWGLETDDMLDHHPDRAPGRSFSTLPFVVRVERQILLPLPAHDAGVFLIGTAFVDRATILGDEALWRPLKKALQGMSPEAREYKGIAGEFEGLMAQFPELNQQGS